MSRNTRNSKSHAPRSESNPPDKDTFFLDNGLCLRVTTGDITKMSAAVVVVGEDNNFSGGGAVAKVVKEAGGRSYQEERDRLMQRIQDKHWSALVYSCPAGNDLKFNYVFHAITSYEGVPIKDKKEHMKKVFSQIAIEAETKEAAKVISPLLGSGMAGLPVNVSLQAAVEGLSNLNPRTLQEVILVEMKPEKAKTIREILKEILEKPLLEGQDSGNEGQSYREQPAGFQTACSSSARRHDESGGGGGGGHAPRKIYRQGNLHGNLGGGQQIEIQGHQFSGSTSSQGNHVPRENNGTAQRNVQDGAYQSGGTHTHQDRLINRVPTQNENFIIQSGDRDGVTRWSSSDGPTGGNDWIPQSSEAEGQDSSCSRDAAWSGSKEHKGTERRNESNAGAMQPINIVFATSEDDEESDEDEATDTADKNTLRFSEDTPHPVRDDVRGRTSEEKRVGDNQRTASESSGWHAEMYENREQNNFSKSGEDSLSATHTPPSAEEATSLQTCVTTWSSSPTDDASLETLRAEKAPLGSKEEDKPEHQSFGSCEPQTPERGDAWNADFNDSSRSENSPEPDGAGDDGPEEQMKNVQDGKMPDGKMLQSSKRNLHLDGFSDCGTILIEYSFPNGTQGPEHPAPGEPYKGTFRRAFLPDNPEGQRVCSLLQKAFDRKLTFEIVQRGASQEWVVDFAAIPHKTSLRGGREGNGFPDLEYLNRVQDALRRFGIK